MIQPNLKMMHIWFGLSRSLALFSSSGQSPGRAIVLPPASALVLALASALAAALTAASALAKC